MSDKNVHLTINTPSRTALEMDSSFVRMRTVEGDMGVLYGHDPCTVMLGYGVLRAITNDKKSEVLMAVLGGFAMIENNRITIITEMAEYPDNLADAIEAREKERAESKSIDRMVNVELQRAEIALRHMLVDMDISSYSILKGHGEKSE